MPNSHVPPMQDASLRTRRLLAASPQAIYAAFAQPELLAQWWGPAGFTNTFQVFEFQPGGRWVFVMHGPQGADYPNECVFRDLQPDARIVIDHVGEPHFQLTVDLTAQGAQTELSWVQAFANQQTAEKLRSLCERPTRKIWIGCRRCSGSQRWSRSMKVCDPGSRG